MNIVFDFGAVLFDWQPVQLVAQHFPERGATLAQARQLAQALFDHADWKGFDHGTVALDQVVARSALRLELPEDRLHDALARRTAGLRPARVPTRLRALRSGAIFSDGVGYGFNEQPRMFVSTMAIHGVGALLLELAPEICTVR